MVKAATLEVEIGAKIDKFERSLGKVRKDLKGMETRLGGVSRGASKATGAFSGMAKKLIAVGIAYFGARGIFKMGKSFLDVATSVETYKLRLEAMLGSQEAATDAMAFFQEVAAKVPFTLEEVIEAGVKVQAFGADLKAWTPIMADLAAYMGVTLPEAAGALGRAFAGGAGAADIFRERGILQVIKDFAKMDKGIDDITKISLPQFREVMFEAFAGAESKVAGTADKLAETWVGVISMLQDKWFKFRDTVMKTKIFELLKEGLVSFNESMDKFVETGELQKWASNTAIAVIEAFKFILEAFKNVVVGFEAMKAALIAITTRFTEMLIDWSEFVLSINKVTKVLGGAFKKEYEDLIARIEFLKGFQEGLNEQFDIQVDKIIALTGAFDPWINKLKDAKEEVEKSKKSIGELGKKTGEVTTGIVESTQVYSKEMVKLITKMTDEVMKLTLNEFEYRKAIALKGYEERKALLEKEKVDKQTFVLLERTLAAELEQIEKDKTKAVKKGYEERGKAITAAMLNWQKRLEEMHAAQTAFTEIATNEFEMMELTIKGFVDAVLKSFEKWALGQIIPKVLAALPFPFNLIAVAGAIASVKAIFAGIKGLKEGGVVMQEGIYHLHPKEMVLPIEKAPQIMREMTSPGVADNRPTNTYVVNISAMDSQDVYRFMIGPGRDAFEKMIRSNVRGIARQIKEETEKF